MVGFSDFYSQARRPSDLVIGCYLYPPVFLAEPNYDDSFSATTVRWRITADECEVLVTVNGGLFVQPPTGLLRDLNSNEPISLKDLHRKMDFEQRACQAMNMVVCELATRGVVSDPATVVYLGTGATIAGHAMLTGASGGREVYMYRTLDRVHDLHQPAWMMHASMQRALDDDFAELPRARALATLSRDTPTLVAAAYSNVSRGQLAEALLTSWIVVEQYIDHLWTKYCAPVKGRRRNSLQATHTYTAAVRCEVLELAGLLEPDVRSAYDAARKVRNDLAHGGRVTRDDMMKGVHALVLTLAKVCGHEVDPPETSTGVGW